MAAAEVPTARAHVCTTAEEAAAALDAFGRAVRRQGRRPRRRQGRRRHRRPRRGARPRGGLRAGGDRGVPRRPRGLALRDHRRHDRLPAAAGPGLQADLRRRRGPQHRRHGRLHPAALGARRTWSPRCCATCSSRPSTRWPAAAPPSPGCSYAGLALTSRGTRVVEFNARFGDPETQPLLALLDSPLSPLLMGAADRHPGTGGRRRAWKAGAAVAVVMASGGLPGVVVLRRRDHRDRGGRGARRTCT